MSVRISVRQVRLQLGGNSILDGVDLEVAPGELMAVMGLSGSGKTSLLRCMAGLLRPTSGQIIVGDVDIVPLPEGELNERRRRMGMVFQYAALFDSLTVYENVVFGLKYHGGHPERELRELA